MSTATMSKMSCEMSCPLSSGYFLSEKPTVRDVIVYIQPERNSTWISSIARWAVARFGEKKIASQPMNLGYLS